MKKYGLLGFPLSHSYSPLIHKEIFKDFGLDCTYSLFEVKEEQLPLMIEKLKQGEYAGFNVTIPYKKEIMKYLDEISPEALEIGSVNTVVLRDGKAIGYNTDYYGFYNQLLHFNVPVKGKECYVLGTGGASLAIYKALVDLGGNVTYVSRRAREGVITYDELEERHIDVLVNTTPVGMSPNIGVSPVKSSVAKSAGYVVDIIFNPRRTQLLLDAGSEMDGLYMLVGQAIKAEELWQGREYQGRISELLQRIERLL